MINFDQAIKENIKEHVAVQCRSGVILIYGLQNSKSVA